MVWFGFLQQFLRELQWSNVAQRVMGPYIVVLPSPVFDYNSRLGQSPELLAADVQDRLVASFRFS
jgi:hypothetical protein